jgi:hypothetical protein
MSERLIDSDDFLVYADYFALAARSGLRSAQSLFRAIQYISGVRVNSFEVFADTFNSKNGMILELQNAYEKIFASAYASDPMKEAFTELANHIKKYSGLELNNYLEQNGIQVDKTYAQLSTLFGDEIDSGNIR